MNHPDLHCAAWLRDTLRLLWSQHVYRTRFFIISTAEELADLPQVTQWLLQNPQDFAAVLARFYGEKRAAALAQLLTDHLTIAAALVNAAKAHDAAKADAARTRWYENAEEISKFLAGINPCWNCCTWKQMMHSHLQMTEQEAALRLAGSYDRDIAQFDAIETEALEMADYMASGIHRQFRLC